MCRAATTTHTKGHASQGRSGAASQPSSAPSAGETPPTPKLERKGSGIGARGAGGAGHVPQRGRVWPWPNSSQALLLEGLSVKTSPLLAGAPGALFTVLVQVHITVTRDYVTPTKNEQQIQSHTHTQTHTQLSRRYDTVSGSRGGYKVTSNVQHGTLGNNRRRRGAPGLTHGWRGSP